MKNESDSLNQAIKALQDKQAKELQLLKEQFNKSLEALKPVNLIKSTFQELSASSEIKNNLLGNAFALGTGVLAKKLLVGKSSHLLKRLLGGLTQYGVTNVVTRNAKGLQSSLENLLLRFMKSRKKDPSKIEKIPAL